MKKVIIYPGRFQPMLSHHVEVYNQLQAKYPGVEVYIGTSDKVEPGKSPFSFKEKQLIAKSQGIDPNKVLFAKRPYVWDDYADNFDTDNTEIFFAVGEKDMQEDPRFAFPNIDKQTGLNLKKNGEPSYYQMINTYKKDPRPMSQRGYIIQAPTVMVSDDVASASAFRQALINAPDIEAAKEVFNKHFKEYNESVFNMVYDKIAGDKKMSEDLNILRQLAGLGVSEDAPVEFDTPLKPEKIKFAPVSKSSAVMSIANRFPAGAKVNDPEVKKEQFLKALMQSPSSLLSEINERIMPDENGLAVSKKLSEIIDSMREQGLMDLDKDDRAFVLKIVKVALKKMKLEAGDDRDFDPESGALENVDLSDIRSDYGVEEALKKNSKGYLVYSNGNPLSFSDWKYENQKEGGEGSEQAYKKYLELVKEEDISEGGDCYHCDGKDPDCKECGGTGYVQFDDDPQEPSQDEIDKHYSKKQESVPFGEPSQQDIMADELNDAFEKGGEEELAKAMGLSIEELDQEMTEFAMDHNLHMDDDRDEVIHGYIAQVVDNADYKDHGEYESIEEAMCGCCGNDPCDCPKDCDGCRKDEAVEDTTAKALEAAMVELRTLAGI